MYAFTRDADDSGLLITALQVLTAICPAGYSDGNQFFGNPASRTQLARGGDHCLQGSQFRQRRGMQAMIGFNCGGLFLLIDR